MRVLLFVSSGVIDMDTGEIVSSIDDTLLNNSGILAGNNLYPRVVSLVPLVRRDHGWSLRVFEARKRNPETGRVGGFIQAGELTYRFPKVRSNGKRYRPGSKRWLCLDFTLWRDVPESEFIPAFQSLLEIANKRGVKLRRTPGGLGSALLRASPAWEKGRLPAPFFISEKVRNHLPGNFYVINSKYKNKKTKHAYYLDQVSSHHTIAASIDLPHPQHLHARGGKDRQVTDGIYKRWIRGINVDRYLSRHIGVICCLVECDTIPPSQQHLYPRWALRKGTHFVWIWTPELRLLDRRIRIKHVSCAFTSLVADPVLREYGSWALQQRDAATHPITKSALLPAYGVLATNNSEKKLWSIVISGRDKPDRSEVVYLPLIDGDSTAHRTTINVTRRPATQNTTARGVIEAETLTRSIEYARQLESQGIPVSQIYADALIAATDQMPFPAKNWRIVTQLTNYSSPHPNQIVADELLRLPGVPGRNRIARVVRSSSVRSDHPAVLS